VSETVWVGWAEPPEGGWIRVAAVPGDRLPRSRGHPGRRPRRPAAV